jgi:AcrR family transcriptional regulator
LALDGIMNGRSTRGGHFEIPFVMPIPTNHRPRRLPPLKHVERESRARQQLLEAAGQVFAEKGFDRATGKEICRRAGMNAAAVNYHFNGIDGLYAAVLREAHGRLFTLDAINAAIAGKVGAKAKLRAILESLLKVLLSPVSSSWVLRVLGREIVAPTQAFDALREKEILPRMRILKSIVGELMGLDDDHPAVARGCLSVAAPFQILIIADRRTLKRVFPAFGFTAADAEAVARQMVQFALAGLSAVAKTVDSKNVDSNG